MLSNFHDLDISSDDALNAFKKLPTWKPILKVIVDDILLKKLVKLRNNFITLKYSERGML